MIEERNPIFDEENQEKLIEKILNAEDMRVYGVNRFQRSSIKKSQFMTTIVTVLLVIIVLIYYIPIISEILLSVVLIIAIIVALFLSYLKYSHDYTKMYMSEFGIAKDSDWDKGAIPWDLLEFIEMQLKRDVIDVLIFRSGRKTLAYRNTRFIKRLTLEIISEYVGGIGSWVLVDDLSEEVVETTKSNTFYMRPNIDKSEGKKRLEEIILREWIGDQDYDAGETEEQVSAKSDEVLYSLILNDPQLAVIRDTSLFTRIFGQFRVSIFCMIIAVSLSFVGMVAGPFSWLIWIVAIIFYILIFSELFMSDERLFLSPIGIVRYYFGSPEALEWKHVEFIDFHTDSGALVPYEFFGNRKRIYCPGHYYKGILSIDHILQFLPELERWKKVNQDFWEDGSFRLIRPDM